VRANNPNILNKWGYSYGGTATNQYLLDVFLKSKDNCRAIMGLHWRTAAAIDNDLPRNSWCNYYDRKHVPELEERIHKRIRELTTYKPMVKEDWL